MISKEIKSANMLRKWLKKREKNQDKVNGKKLSRPEIPIDWKKVDELLMAGCYGTEIAGYIGMHPETFYDRVLKKHGIGFTEYMQQKKSKGDSLLRAHQYAKALGLTTQGDNTLLIWLGKNRLGQKENHEEQKITSETVQKFAEIMEQISKIQSSALKIADNNINNAEKS
jgi:hypothetical protein